jgi:hypothetical protein
LFTGRITPARTEVIFVVMAPMMLLAILLILVEDRHTMAGALAPQSAASDSRIMEDVSKSTVTCKQGEQLCLSVDMCRVAPYLEYRCSSPYLHSTRRCVNFPVDSSLCSLRSAKRKSGCRRILLVRSKPLLGSSSFLFGVYFFPAEMQAAYARSTR